MATSETRVQAFVHALEEGGWVGRIRLILLLAVIAAVYCIVILSDFKGLSHGKGMDQAQVGRQIASGRGFTTKYIRPLAYSQFTRFGKPFPSGDLPDTYNAPLNPYIESLVLRFTKDSWAMTDKDVVYSSDRFIAGFSLLCFLASVAINFLVAKRLFDRRLALLGMGLILVCDVFWNFSQSGLPQMLMLLIFSLVCFCLMRALECRFGPQAPLPPEAGSAPPGIIRRVLDSAGFWLGLSGIGFGLLVLAHGLAIWMFFGALLYLAITFRPPAGPFWKRVLFHPAWIPVLVVAIMVGPWLLRLFTLTGNPFGLAIYSIFGELAGSETQIMRSLSLDTSGISFALARSKIQQNIISQISSLYSFLGHSLIAPVFFLSLLHLFKRPDTASFRWCVLSMWGFAVLGMSVFGMEELGDIHANDLHVLFIPMTIFYGLAFVLVLWSRITTERQEINIRLIRWGFFTLIYLFSAFPLIHYLVTASGRVQWPPYVPPYIAILGEWTDDSEIIASDMPWAVAWYANRKGLLLPDTVASFIDFHDYDRLGAPVVGLYLTPVSGDAKFLSEIMNGEYKEWAPFILRNVNTRSFPLEAVTALPLQNECVFYADHNRWSAKTE